MMFDVTVESGALQYSIIIKLIKDLEISSVR